MKKNLFTRIYESVGPSFEIDKENKTYKVIDEGLFFLHLTEAYFTLRGYSQIEEN